MSLYDSICINIVYMYRVVVYVLNIYKIIINYTEFYSQSMISKFI